MPLTCITYRILRCPINPATPTWTSSKISKKAFKMETSKNWFCVCIYIIVNWSNLVWHWNGKRRLIVELRFHWKSWSKPNNQTKHRQTCLSKFADDEGKTNQTIKPNADTHICLYLPIHLKYICAFTCIQWFVYACKCLPVGASFGSLRSPRPSICHIFPMEFHAICSPYRDWNKDAHHSANNW